MDARPSVPEGRSRRRAVLFDGRVDERLDAGLESRSRRRLASGPTATPRARLKEALKAGPLAGLAGLMLACGSPTGSGLLVIQYAPWLEIDIHNFTETPSGLFYKDTTVGEGAQVGAGSTVTAVIEGWLHDGTYAYPRTTITVRQGSREPVRGVDEALLGMRVGGRRKAVLPPALAAEGSNVFVFVIEVSSVQ